MANLTVIKLYCSLETVIFAFYGKFPIRMRMSPYSTNDVRIMSDFFLGFVSEKESRLTRLGEVEDSVDDVSVLWLLYHIKGYKQVLLSGSCELPTNIQSFSRLIIPRFHEPPLRLHSKNQLQNGSSKIDVIMIHIQFQKMYRHQSL